MIDQHLLFSDPWMDLTVIGETSSCKWGMVESDAVFTMPVDEKWPTADYIVELVNQDKQNVYYFVLVHDREHTTVEAVYNVVENKWITIDNFNNDHIFTADEYMNRAKFF